MNRNKIIFIIGIIILIIFIISIFIIFSKEKNTNETNTEEINKRLEQIGSEYYKNTYYKGLGEDKEALANFLQKYKDNGIPFDLENLKRTGNGIYKQDIEDLLNKKELKCDDKKTKIIIYPKEPYEKDDFEIKIELDCE